MGRAARLKGGGLYLPAGESVVAPPSDERVFSIDGTGAAFITNPDGTTTSVGGSASAPLWGGQYATFFQSLTGLSPFDIVSWFSNTTNYQDNAAGGAGSGSQGGSASGTAAAVSYNTGATNGVITLLGPNAGAGFADLSSSIGGFNQCANMRTKRWLAAMVFACGKQPSAPSAVSLGVIANTTLIGFGFLGADANWTYVRGTTPGATVHAALAGTPAIDFSDAVYKHAVLYNDGTNLKGIFDVKANGLTSAALQTLEASANIPASAGRLFLDNEGTAAADKIEFAGACFFNEF